MSLGEGIAGTCHRDSWRAVVNGAEESGKGTLSLMAYLAARTFPAGRAALWRPPACWKVRWDRLELPCLALAAHWTTSSKRKRQGSSKGVCPARLPLERDWPAAKGRLCAAPEITEASAERLCRGGNLDSDRTGALILSCDAPGAEETRRESVSRSRTHAPVEDINNGKALGTDAEPGAGHAFECMEPAAVQTVTDDFRPTATTVGSAMQEAATAGSSMSLVGVTVPPRTRRLITRRSTLDRSRSPSPKRHP